MTIRHLRSTLLIIFMLITFACVGTILTDGGSVYGAESGTCTVTTKHGDYVYSGSVRGGWDYCDKHPFCTLKFTSDVVLESGLNTGGRTDETIIYVDMNGYSIDCKSSSRAFRVLKQGIVRLYNSQYKTSQSYIRNTKHSAIYCMGEVNVENVNFSNCVADGVGAELGDGGGACEVVTVYLVTKITEATASFKNCTFDNCKAIGSYASGGAINVRITDALGEAESDNKSLFESIGNDAGRDENALELVGCTFTNCQADTGGALSAQGCVLVDSCTFSNNTAEKGGAIYAGENSVVNISDSTIKNNKALTAGNLPNGAGIYIVDGYFNPMQLEAHYAGAVSISDSTITNNIVEASYLTDLAHGAGISVESNTIGKTSGKSYLRLGGKIIAKGNYIIKDSEKYLSNIDLGKKALITIGAEGLSEGSDVGVGTSRGDNDIPVAKIENDKWEIAEATAAKMFADHAKSISTRLKEPIKDEDRDNNYDVYDKPSDPVLYLGASRKAYVTKVTILDTNGKEREIPVEVDNEKNTITATFNFETGYWNQGYKVYWWGPGGNIRSHSQTVGVTDNPFSSAVATHDSYDSVEDTITIERNGGMRTYKVNFYNPKNLTQVNVENGYIEGKYPVEYYGTHKKYYLNPGEKVQVVANVAPSSNMIFVGWSLSPGGYAGWPLIRYEFNDYDKTPASFRVPICKSTQYQWLTFEANYSEKSTVKVVNGYISKIGNQTVHTDLSYVPPGETVTVKINEDITGSFNYWYQPSTRKFKLTEQQKTAKEFTFTMPTGSNYDNLYFEAKTITVENPRFTPEPGTYTGPIDVVMNGAGNIYYSVDGSAYKKYEKGIKIKLDVAETSEQQEHVIKAYAIAVDYFGKEHPDVRSETVTGTYLIKNPQPKVLRNVTVINGVIKGGGTTGQFMPGEKVTVVADPPRGFRFSSWDGKGTVKLWSHIDEEVSFTMPYNDVTLEAKLYPSKEYTIIGINAKTNGESIAHLYEYEEAVVVPDKVVGRDFDYWELEGIKLYSRPGKIFSFKVHSGTITTADRTAKATACYTKYIVQNPLKVINGYIDGDESVTEKTILAHQVVRVTAKDSITAANGQKRIFDHWKLTKGDAYNDFELTPTQLKSPDIKFLMATTSLTLEAVYRTEYTKEKVLVVKGHFQGTGKSLDEFTCGDTVNIVADAPSGMEFTHWTAEGVTLTEEQASKTSTSFTMPDNAVTVTANFEKIHSVLSTNGKNYKEGEELKAAEYNTYIKNNRVVVKANDNTSTHRFKKWVVVSAPEGFKLTAEQIISSQFTMTMPDGDVVLEAQFSEKYKATAINGTISGDGITGSTTGKWFEGESLAVKAVIPDGAEFDHWECTGITLTAAQRKAANITVTMPANDIVLRAVLKSETPMRTLAVEQAQIGDDATKTVGVYGEGTPGIVVKGVNPDSSTKSRYVFDGWEVVEGPSDLLTEAQKASEAIEITMPAQNVRLKANYKLILDTVNVIHGKIFDNSTGEYTHTFKEVKRGSSVIVRADTAGDMLFDHWDAYGIALTEEQKTQSEAMVFTMPSNDVYLIACYKNPLPIYSLLTVNGTNQRKLAGTPEERGQYAANEEITVTAVNPGTEEQYKFKKWTVVSAPAGFKLTAEQTKSSSFAMTMPEGDVILKAEFYEKHKATVFNGKVNDVEPVEGVSSGKWFEGTELTVTANVVEGSTFDHWECTGITIEDSRATSFTVKMPANDVSFRAVYKTEPTALYILSVEQAQIDEDATKTEQLLGAGTTIKVKGINPDNTQYVFDGWEVVEGPSDLLGDQTGNEAATFTMPAQNVKLKANYKLVSGVVYMVRGKIFDTIKGTYVDRYKEIKKDTPVKVSADLASGMIFDYWEAYGVELTDEQIFKGTDMSFTMPSNDVVLIAHYKTIRTLLTVNGTSKIEGLTDAVQESSYSVGSEITISGVKPTRTSVFKRWRIVQAPDDFKILDNTEETTIVMPAEDVVLEAEYAEEYDVTGIRANVTVRKSNEALKSLLTLLNSTTTQKANEGDLLTIKAEMGASLIFDHWETYGIELTDEQRKSEEISVVMPASEVIIMATYKGQALDVHNFSVESGTIVGEPDETSRSKDFYTGSLVTVTPDVLDGMKFDHWDASGIELTEEESKTAMLTVEMPNNDVKLTAKYTKFEIVPHVVTIVNGKIADPILNKTGLFYANSRVFAEADTKIGYTFKCWKVEGMTLTEEQAKSARIEFLMPDNDVTLTAEYTKNPGINTGDNTKIILFAGLGLIAVAGAAGVLVARRKKEN